MPEQKTKKCCNCKAPFLIFALFVLIVAFFLNANITNENGANVGLNTEVSVENNIDDKQEKADKQVNEKSEEKENIISYSFDANDGERTVFSGLLNHGEENNIEVKYNNDYSFGVFVESVAGIKNGDDGKYWQYYVNDTLGEVAADKKVLESGDKVEWRFEEVPF